MLLTTGSIAANSARPDARRLTGTPACERTDRPPAIEVSSARILAREAVGEPPAAGSALKGAVWRSSRETRTEAA
jgi:hypothetical protein